MNLIYLCYHLIYVSLYVFQEMDIGNNMTILRIIKYFGFAIVILILLGGFVEIIIFLIPVIIFICHLTKKLCLLLSEKLFQE